MSVAELAKVVGEEGEYAPKGGLVFVVVVKDARQSFGRLDYLISPKGGRGEQWVSGDRVKLQHETRAVAAAH